MDKIIGVVLWIAAWVKLNAASLIGILQAIVKGLKELGTAVVNLVALFVPAFMSAAIVGKVRGIFNAIDAGLEWVKVNLLPKIS